MQDSKPLQILYEDNHLLALDKPAGIATMGALPGQPTMAKLAADYLKHKYNKPGNAFVGVVSRLDSRVSGVLLLARTSKAASRLSDQIRKRTPQKRYLAWVETSKNGSMPQASNEHTEWTRLSDHLVKNEREQCMQVIAAPNAQSQLAELDFRLLTTEGTNALVEVNLITGRKHQIRVQLASAGMPIVGDTKYGSHRKFSGGIALHCHRLTIMHPTLREELLLECSPLTHWKNPPRSFLTRLSEIVS